MPVDFQQIRKQVKQMGAQAPGYRQRAAEKLQTALSLFNELAEKNEEIQQRIEKAAASEPGLRCAVPAVEPILSAVPPPFSGFASVILAADGSQINPSRHEAADFGVINLGALRLAKDEPPRESVTSKLLFYDEIETPAGSLSEEMIALMRDVGERRLLADLAKSEIDPVVALTDGMLEVFGEPRKEPGFEEQFNEYLASLRDLSELKTIVAGYVDKPRADLLARMLELMAGSEEDMLKRVRERPFGGVTDSMLFSGRLAPGMRSAVFGIQSRSSKVYTGPLKLHFFYLNVGFDGAPLLARVEIPAWVAESGELINLLHTTLVAQCAITGSKPYPYILHRAHEIAVVGIAERDQISSMIDTELRGLGMEPGEKSFKQGLKDLEGKTRYER
jgi:hypothetical protein